MIVTVTINPAIDKTARVERLIPGGLNRLSDLRWDAGGKGINVSRTIAALGGTSTATGFLAGQTGAAIQNVLETIPGIVPDFVRIPGQTRTNLKLVEPDGTLTELNEQGPSATPEGMTALTAKLQQFCVPGNVLVLSGSVCPGVPEDIYAELTQMAHSGGAKVLVDADGALLARAVEAKPDMIKPNQFELCRLFGTDDTSVDSLITMGQTLLEKGIGGVCISRGAQGALMVTDDGVYRWQGASIPVQSSVGAGDAMVAALCMGMDSGMTAEACFRLACAAGTAACTTAGTTPPDGEAVQELASRIALEMKE